MLVPIRAWVDAASHCAFIRSRTVGCAHRDVAVVSFKPDRAGALPQETDACFTVRVTHTDAANALLNNAGVADEVTELVGSAVEIRGAAAAGRQRQCLAAVAYRAEVQRTEVVVIAIFLGVTAPRTDIELAVALEPGPVAGPKVASVGERTTLSLEDPLNRARSAAPVLMLMDAASEITQVHRAGVTVIAL
jgi:hypothetical protein